MGAISLVAAVTSFATLGVCVRRPTALIWALPACFFVNICHVILRIIYYLYIHPVISPLRKFPGPKQAPVLDRIFDSVKADDVVKWFDSIPNDGLIRAFGSCNDEFLIATKPEVVREILATNAYDWVKPPKVTALLSLSIGNGVIAAEGSPHKRQRKLLQPAFHNKHIQELCPTFWNTTKKMLRVMHTNRNKSVEMSSIMSRTALDIIAIAGFGQEFGTIENEDAPMMRQYRAMFDSDPDETNNIVPVLISKVLPWKVMLNLPVEQLRRVKRAREAVEAEILQGIQSRRAILTSGKKLETKDILSVAMQSESFSNEELVEQAMTFVSAGSDTTAFTLTCAIFELCRNQALQDRFRNEVRSKLPSPESDGTITLAAVDDLRWVTAVVNETLRVYPSVNVSARVSVTKNSVVAGHKIPLGTMIDIPISAMNRNRNCWGGPYDPLEYHAERWFEDEKEGIMNKMGGASDPYAFMTFFRGVRGCMGEKFARSEIAIILAMLVGRFRMTLAPGKDGKIPRGPKPDIFYTFTGKIRHGLYVKLEEIEGW